MRILHYTPNISVTLGNEKEKSSGGIEDVQFRRQSFDRNSVLRQSKKRTRKNSTASVTANGSVTTSPRLNDISTLELSTPTLVL